MFLWFQIINCTSIDWNYTRLSNCDGRIINVLDSDFLSDGYLDVFDVCEKHRRCGCIETCNGVFWVIAEGTNTSARHPPWWSKLCTTKPMPMCHWQTCHTWVSKWITFSSRNFKYKDRLNVWINILHILNLFRHTKTLKKKKIVEEEIVLEDES